MLKDLKSSPSPYPGLMLSGLFSWQAVKNTLLLFLMLLVDYFLVVAAVETAYFLRANVFPAVTEDFFIPPVYRFAFIPAAFCVFLHFERREIRKFYFWQQAQQLCKATAYAMFLVIVILYFTKFAQDVSRLFIGLVGLLAFAYLCIGRYLVKRFVMTIGALQTPVIMIGAGRTAELMVDAFERNLGSGYRVVGLIEDNPEQSPLLQQYRHLGSFSQAEDIIQAMGIRNVLITAPGLCREELVRLIYRIQPYVDKVMFVPDLFGVPVSGLEVEALFNEQAILMKVRNNLAQSRNRLLKWLFDSLFALAGCLFLLPVFALISILIYRDSPGPVVFAHRRVGSNGEMFPCFKFRTMVANAEEALERHLAENPAAKEEWDREFKLKDDPRITKIGRFLRKTSLDELPQFFNVLRGEMSLVGPRPIVRGEIEKYGEFISDYYLVRPGITGMWQVGGRNDIDYPERVRMDSWYVRNWSFWLDVVMIFKTIRVVLERKGAY